MPGEPFGPPGIVYISGGAIQGCGIFIENMLEAAG